MSAGRARAPGPLRRLLRGEGQRRRRPPPSLFTTAPRDRNGAAAPLNGRADPALLRRASTDHPLEMGTRRGADAGAPACRGPSKGLVAAATAGSPTRIGPSEVRPLGTRCEQPTCSPADHPKPRSQCLHVAQETVWRHYRRRVRRLHGGAVALVVRKLSADVLQAYIRTK